MSVVGETIAWQLRRRYDSMTEGECCRSSVAALNELTNQILSPVVQSNVASVSAGVILPRQRAKRPTSLLRNDHGSAGNH